MNIRLFIALALGAAAINLQQATASQENQILSSENNTQKYNEKILQSTKKAAVIGSGIPSIEFIEKHCGVTVDGNGLCTFSSNLEEIYANMFMEDDCGTDPRINSRLSKI